MNAPIAKRVKKANTLLPGNADRKTDLTRPLKWAFLLILLLGIFLRFWNLAENPLWYSDEGVHLNRAWNLIHGRLQYSGMKYYFWGHGPLHPFVTGLLMLIFGKSILILRIYTASLSILTAILLYLIARECGNGRIGLVGMALFLINPSILPYHRWNFTHIEEMFLIILTAFFGLKYLHTQSRRWFYLLGIAAGLAFISELQGIVAIILGVIIVFLTEKRKVFLFLAVSLGIFLATFLLLLGTQLPSFIWKTIHGVAKRAGPEAANNASALPGIISRFYGTMKFYIHMLGSESVMNIIGLSGFFFIKNIKDKIILLSGLALTMAVIIFSSGPTDWSYFYRAGQIFRPFIVLGLAIIIYRLFDYFRRTVQDKFNQLTSAKETKKEEKVPVGRLRRLITPTLIIIFVLPFLPTVKQDIKNVVSGFKTDLDFLIVDPKSSRVIADYLNDRISPNDLVIAPIHMSWLVKAKTADIVLASYYTAKKHQLLSREELSLLGRTLGRGKNSEFIYSCDLHEAKFISIQPNVSKVIRTTADWPVVFTYDGWTILENPKYKQ